MKNVTFEHHVAILKKHDLDILESLTPGKCDAIHMSMGVATEAGELLDAVKRYTMYDKALDRGNVVEELGDLEFYMEGLRQRFQITRQETLVHNMNKLAKRYPEGYSDRAAQERADKQ